MVALTSRRVGAVLISLTLGLAGCGGSGPGATDTASPAPATSSASWDRPDTPPDPHTLLRAGEAALAKVPNSTLTFIESQTDDAGTWKVLMATPDGAEQELKIGVDGITVLVGPTPKDNGDAVKAQRRATMRAARLDYRSAVDKMLAAVPNGSITELKLVTSNGPVWQADVWDTYLVEHIVTVNAVSGDVVANNQV